MAIPGESCLSDANSFLWPLDTDNDQDDSNRKDRSSQNRWQRNRLPHLLGGLEWADNDTLLTDRIGNPVVGERQNPDKDKSDSQKNNDPFHGKPQYPPTVLY